jgi:hypothetical protein
MDFSKSFWLYLLQIADGEAMSKQLNAAAALEERLKALQGDYWDSGDEEEADSDPKRGVRDDDDDDDDDDDSDNEAETG